MGPPPGCVRKHPGGGCWGVQKWRVSVTERPDCPGAKLWVHPQREEGVTEFETQDTKIKSFFATPPPPHTHTLAYASFLSHLHNSPLHPERVLEICNDAHGSRSCQEFTSASEILAAQLETSCSDVRGGDTDFSISPRG